MTTTTDERPALYCGTYNKYNNGSIAGKWLYLDDYSDSEAFLKACADLHKDESDPEFMFQDFEYMPDSLYSESLSKIDLDKIYQWLEYDEDERAIIADYWDNISSDSEPDYALECYEGNINDMRGEGLSFSNNDIVYGWHIIDSSILGDVPDHLVNYIDVESVGRDYSQDVTITDEGNIFGNR